jgi:peptide chain release factor subunit 3
VQDPNCYTLDPAHHHRFSSKAQSFHCRSDLHRPQVSDLGSLELHLNSDYDCSLVSGSAVMSKLNINAYEFVPGKGFRSPEPAQPAQPPLPPVERPPPPEVVVPPPTISLNIGGSKPPPPIAPSAIPPAAQHSSSTPKSTTPAPAHASTPSSKPVSHSASPAPPRSFTLEKAKTDTAAIVQEVHKIADQELLKDLFGDGVYLFLSERTQPLLNLATAKEHLNIVFIGHVDAGKSTMGGNLLYLCGTVDKRTMEKYEKEAKEAGRETWYLSWALDSTPQERSKGKTVEVGRAYFETATRRYTILDAPGHKTYVPSMIAGAAQADVGILVISARKGEFETGFERGGQTREHIMLVKTAGVSKVICAINKMDDPTVEWQKSRYDEIKDKMTPFIKAAGFNPKTDVTFMPVSGYTGYNLKDRVAKSVCPWWE